MCSSAGAWKFLAAKPSTTRSPVMLLYRDNRCSFLRLQKKLGKSPTRLQSTAQRVTRLVRFLNDAGSWPASNGLIPRYSFWRPVSWPSSAGMVPAKRLVLSSRYCRFRSPESDTGMVPLNWLLSRRSVVSLAARPLPMSAGSTPPKRFLDRLMCTAAKRSGRARSGTRR
ncbi:unnamed protein product [Urochloa humidicola]